METIGVFLDSDLLKNLEKTLQEAIQNCEKEVEKMSGITGVNIASPKQLQELLFDTMKIKPLKKTKTGWSVDEETLNLLAETEPVANIILRHRHASKLLWTYVRGLMKYRDTSGRIHTTYDTLGAATGRLSSDSPNLQNIPAGDEWSDEIKSAFRPSETDWSYVVADYSQIEIRILACLSSDETMLQVFREWRDLHTETAKFIFKKEAITDAERKIAKTVNFGVIYGITPFGLSKMIPQSPAECAEYIAGFYTLYPETQNYFAHIISETERAGYAETYFWRRREIRGINDNNSMVREASKREAMNMPIQGTCADILKYAMVWLDTSFIKQKLQARLLMSVHDEIVVECPDDEIEIVESTMREVMENIVHWDIPMTVSIGHGKTWRSAK